MLSMDSRRFRSLFVLLALVGAAAMLGACGSAAPAEQPAGAPAPEVSQPPAALPTAEPGEQQQAPAPTDESPDEAAPAAAPTATVDVSPNLRASDPSTVVLASGEPQLIEFFAFW